MKILIVGGGIAGMATAALLQKQGHNILIIDNAPEYRHIGFGLYLWHYGRQVLDELGIGHHLIGKEYMAPGTVIQNTKYKTIKYIAFSSYGNYRPISIHRADLHEGLRETVTNVPVRFNTTVKSVQQDETGVTVQFSNDTADHFDLVVGADGIHSSIRTMVMENSTPKPYGWRGWFFWADSWKRKSEEVQALLGPGQGLAVYPLHDRHFAGLNTACSPDEPDPIETRRERLHQYVSSFHKDVHDLIDSLDMNTVYHTDLMYVPNGPWAKGRVVLIGDARHAISPITGRGANLALEDASVLASSLKGISTKEVPSVLQKFGVERMSRVESLRKHLRRTEFFMLIKSPLLASARNVAMGLLPESIFPGKPDPRFL